MKRRNKIMCLALMFLIAFGGIFLSPMMMSNNQAVLNIDRSGSGFVVAGDGDSALDGEGPNENNMTMNIGGVTSPIIGEDDIFAGGVETYSIFVNASDADGYGDIDYINIALQTGAVANVSVFQWEVATFTLTEIVGATLVRLGTWTNTCAVNDVDIRLDFTIEWEMGARTDLDLNITCYDNTKGASQLVNDNLDVIATLTMSDSTMFLYNDYLNGESFGTIACTWHYTGHTTLYPLDAETDFHVSMAAVPAEAIAARTWVSTSYAEGNGTANFNNIIAPDTNTRQQLTFTMISVDNGDGAAGTNLNAIAYTDTVFVDPNAPIHPDDGGGGGIIPPIFDSLEGTLLVGGAVVVLMTGVYYAYGRSTSSSPRRRTSKRKKTVKKRKRKR